MSKTILITQPNYDYTTRYISSWAEKVIQYALNKNNKVIALKNDRANKDTLKSIVKKTNPSFIFLNGHGDDNVVTGNDIKPLISIKDDIHFLKNKIIYALSCRSAKKLGPYCVKNGTQTYIGYTEDFVFTYDRLKRTRPYQDKIAGLFLNPSNVIPFSLLKGKTTNESYKDSQNAFRKTIRNLLTSESTIQQSSTVRFLIWDMQHQVCLGDRDARI